MSEEIKPSDFEKDTTASSLELDNIIHGSKLHELIEKLNCFTQWGQKDPEKSIMHHEQLCQHDSGYLCEHRLQFIIDYIKENYES